MCGANVVLTCNSTAIMPARRAVAVCHIAKTHRCQSKICYITDTCRPTGCRSPHLFSPQTFVLPYLSDFSERMRAYVSSCIAFTRARSSLIFFISARTALSSARYLAR